jgi:hypothetical protein
MQVHITQYCFQSSFIFVGNVTFEPVKNDQLTTSIYLSPLILKGLKFLQSMNSAVFSV